MKRFKWSIILGLSLLSASAILYLTHYLIFGEFRRMAFAGMGRFAFVPIQGLIMTLIVAELLMIVGRRSRMQKMNMVIGVFFSELGTKLLRKLYFTDPDGARLREAFEVADDLSGQQVNTILRKMDDYPYSCNVERTELGDLKSLLVGERDFMVRLLENPNLLENERFTEVLWAVFHLTEELDARKDITQTPESDLQHLRGDVTRVYGHLFREWLWYMRHLHDNYPFLFSFAMRTSPIEQEIHVEVA
jgi:hypothetical protein